MRWLSPLLSLDCVLSMNLKIVVHEAEEGGFWAEAPALPGCASEGETFDELMTNMRQAIDGWLAVDLPPVGVGERIVELAV